MVALRVMGEAVLQAPHGRLTPAASRVFSLALLLILDREHPWERDDLVRLVWPEASQSNGRHNLRQGLYRLRTLGIPVETTGERVTLGTGVVVRSDEPSAAEDPATMSAAINSGSRRIGRFLGGYDPTFSSLLREWVEERRAQAHARVRVVLVHCLEHLRRAARWGELEQMSSLMLEFDPLNETATLFRAEVAALSGDKVGALRMLSDYAEEVGQVHGDIAIPAKILRRRVSERMYLGATTPTTSFVGRHDQLQTFYRFIGSVRDGRARTLTVLGRHGEGRSRLLEEFLYVAQTQGFSTVLARFDSRDQQKPFSSVNTIVAKLLELPGAIAVAPDTLDFLSQVMSGEIDMAPSDDGGRKMGEAVGALLASVAEENRLIIALDDFDHADVASLEALRASIPQLQLKDLGFVVSAVSDPSIAESLTQDPSTRITSELLPLDLESTHALTRSIAGAAAPSEVLEWIVAQSGGSPLHISILATHWEITRTCSTPPSLTDTLRLALSEQSPQALRLLHLISAARLCRNIGCLQQLSGHSLNELYELLRDLETGNLLAVRDNSIVLSNPLIADVVASLSGQAANSVIHRMIALHLESEHAGSAPHKDAWERAYHWLASGDVEAASEAVQYCLRDLWRAGLPRETAQMAVSLVGLSSSSHQRRRIVHAILTALDEAGNWGELLRLARRLPPATPHTEVEPWEHVASVFAHFRHSGDARTALAELQPHIENRKASVASRVHAADHAMRIAEVDLNNRAIEQIYRMVHPLIADSTTLGWSALVCQIVFHSSVGVLDQASEAADILVQDARRTGDIANVSRSLRFRSSVHERQSDLPAAQADLEEALHLGEQAEAKVVVSIVVARMLELCIEAGDDDAAQHWFNRLRQIQESLVTDTLSDGANSLLEGRFELSRNDGALPTALRERIALSSSGPRRISLQSRAILLHDAVRRKDRRTVGRHTKDIQRIWIENQPSCGVDYAACVTTLGLYTLGESESARAFLDAHLASRREPRVIHPGILKLLPPII